MNIFLPSREDIHASFIEGEDAVVLLFTRVDSQLSELCEQLSRQAAAIQALEARLNKDSSNSSKPPSSDGLSKKNISEKENRTESLRKSGQKPNGGQDGHQGHTLKQTRTPEYIDYKRVSSCKECGLSLDDTECCGHEERQVFDIPAMHISVTSHMAEIKICPCCKTKNRGEFPEGISRPTQYGNGVKTWAAYFTNQHFVSVERTSQIFKDLCNHTVAEGTILKACKTLVSQIQPATEAVKRALQQVDILHLDESGVRVCGKLHWLHVASTNVMTHYQVHEKRGQIAINANDIVPHFSGIAIHDHWKPYFTYSCTHALCNAHHLRELQFIAKQYGQLWATAMFDLLLQINSLVKETRIEAECLSEETACDFARNYDLIVEAGYAINPLPVVDADAPKKRGCRKQTPPRNLLNRFRDFKAETLAFMYDFRVPFTNNLAEQDVRMIKVKQKVSGSFRTLEGAECFTNIRGYISTARKNKKNIYDVIKQAFNNNPFIPPIAFYNTS
ncbi:MAG: IS66 family transposase [Mariprofundales bacterium]